MIALRIYSFIYNIQIYIRSLVLLYLVTGSWYLLTCLHSILPPLTPYLWKLQI